MMLSRLMFRYRALVIAAVAAFGATAEPSSAQQWPPGPGAAPPPPGQSYQSQLCTRLEGQLAAIDRGGGADPARAEQVRRYEEASSKQQAELDRMAAQSRRAGCEGTGFFLFGALQSQSQQCVDLNRQISSMRGNLDRINVDLQRLRGGDLDRGEQRRSVMVSLAQNNCGPQYRAAVQQPQSGGFLSTLFGGNGGGGEGGVSAGENVPGDATPSALPSGSYRTVCVRTCDGYYFPISYSTNQSRFADDERVCQRMCPAAEVMLFSHRNPGEDINQAVSVSGQNYTQLPNAFKYRTAFNRECSCRKPGQTWADALEGRDATIERGDIVVTEERAKQLSQPKQASPQQPQRTSRPGGGPAAGQPGQPTAADNPTGPDTGKKPVRTVGPPFIPAR
jgi:hypothetical protein